MTALEIGIAAALKGVIVAALIKWGKWPDWEMRALRREEHRRVIKAYEQMCEQTGKRPCEDAEAVAKMKKRRGY